MSWRAAVGRSMASLKIMACPESGSSAAARAFWANNYQTVKQMNPTFPFMIRAAVNTPTPYMIVEYDLNYKVQVPLEGLDEKAIESKVVEAVETGKSMPKAYWQSGRAELLPSVVE